MPKTTAQSAVVSPLSSPAVRDLSLVVGASLFMAICARIAVPLPFTPVPLTLANFERAFYRSTIADNNSYEQWESEGSKDAMERANAIWKRMLAESVNEQLRMRASYHAAHSTDECDVRFDPSDYYLVDPVERKAQAELEAVEAEIAAQTEPELEAAGWM